jgi:hypothetical protein
VADHLPTRHQPHMNQRSGYVQEAEKGDLSVTCSKVDPCQGRV